MSVEADFGLSGWVAQDTGTELSWDITWPEIGDDRYVAVSFQSDVSHSELVRISEWFTCDADDNNHVGELIRVTNEWVGGTAWRFCVIVIPNH